MIGSYHQMYIPSRHEKTVHTPCIGKEEWRHVVYWEDSHRVTYH
jgi:hypothetical protein